MIKAPLALFQVQVKSRRWHAIELLQAPPGIAPEALDAVDVTVVISKLVRAMIDSQVFSIADINKSVVAAPAVTVNDGVCQDATANNGLQGSLFAVRHDLRVDLALSLEEAEDDGLAPGTATALAAHAMRAEVRFIHFNFTVFKR